MSHALADHVVPEAVDSRAARVRLRAAQQAAADILRHWPGDLPFDAENVLRKYPDLRDNSTAVFNLAFEEFVRKQRDGIIVPVEEFAARFPAAEGPLLEALPFHDFLEGDPAKLAGFMTPPWPSAGETFLELELLEELGRGAFSRVFLAAESELGKRPIVVKVCQRGRREGQILGHLQHPHIVPIFSIRPDPYSILTALCMPYLSRATLFDVLREAFTGGAPPSDGAAILRSLARIHQRAEMPGPPAVPSRILQRGSYDDAVAELGGQLADALAHTHARGFRHGDLKPSNVLLTPDGRAMLLDFNVSSSEALNDEGLGGTLPYMAPEQLRVVARPELARAIAIDGRADLFGLGAALYETLTGRLPFGAPQDIDCPPQEAEWMLALQRRGLRPLRQFNQAVDAELAELIEKCLAIDPRGRPQSAGELAAAFRRHLSRRRRIARTVRRRPRTALAVLIALVLASCTLAGVVAAREPHSVRQYQLGYEAHRQGRYDAAVRHFSRALESAPADADALFARGRAYLHSGAREDFRQARRDFQAAAELVEDGRITACLGYCAGRFDRDYGVAVALFEQARQQGFSSAALDSNLGHCYEQLGRIDDADRALGRALVADDRLQAAWHNQARIFHRRAQQARADRAVGLLDKALDCIGAALRLGPPSDELSLRAACIYALAAEHGADESYRREALMHCQHAVEYGLDPQQLEAVSRQLPALASDPQFRRLQRLPAPRRTPCGNLCLIDPLTGLDEPVRFTVP